MSFDKLLDNCINLENAISALIDTNASKESELSCLQTSYLEYTQADLDQLAERELALRNDLEGSRSKKEELESDIKHLTDINEKLSEWVSNAQKTNNDKSCLEDKNQEVYMLLIETMQDYEQIKSDYQRVYVELTQLIDGIQVDTSEVKELVKVCNELVVGLHRNDKIIKVLDQQNRHGEQQFDLILQQLPWEPLTDINDLRKHNDEAIRNLAEVLQVQANEINELKESLDSKKQRKLEILEQLANQLNHFVNRREEAILMDTHHRDGLLSTSS